MLLLAKLAALGIVIWFYMTAEKNGEPAVKWAVIGLIGYLLVWFLIDLIIDSSVSTTVAAKRGAGSFVLGQIPTLAGLVAAVFIRKKLLSNMGKPS
jgi:uncharacterized membrane protein YjfL (UPF0719 family)